MDRGFHFVFAFTQTPTHRFDRRRVPILLSLASSADRVVRGVRRHPPDRNLSRSYQHGLVDIRHGDRQTVVPTRPHRHLQQHRHFVLGEEPELRGDTRRRHQIIHRHRGRRRLFGFYGVVQVQSCDADRGAVRARSFTFLLLDEILVGAFRGGVRVADKPRGKLDLRVLEIALPPCQQERVGKRIRVRARLHIRRPVLVLRSDPVTFHAELSHRRSNNKHEHREQHRDYCEGELSYDTHHDHLPPLW